MATTPNDGARMPPADVVIARCHENLCYSDPRNPLFEALHGEDEVSPTPRLPGCACDNCHYGHDYTSLWLLELLEIFVLSMAPDDRAAFDAGREIPS